MNTTAIIVCVIIAVIIIVISAILVSVTEDEGWVLLIFLALIPYSIAFHLAHPIEGDVRAGKAVYQETITITQTGDSIKTYQIVWKEK